MLKNNDRKSNSSKTFYDEGKNGKTHLQTIKPAECFGDFWNDIFSIKIIKKKDERITVQKNIKSHQIIHGVKNELSDCKKRADLGRFNTYIRQIILYNSTPKVNLVGKGSKNSWNRSRLPARSYLTASQLFYIWTFKGNVLAELTYFIILLLYALLGLTYDTKTLDYVMVASWLNYFLLTFRSEFVILLLVWATIYVGDTVRTMVHNTASTLRQDTEVTEPKIHILYIHLLSVSK